MWAGLGRRHCLHSTNKGEDNFWCVLLFPLREEECFLLGCAIYLPPQIFLETLVLRKRPREVSEGSLFLDSYTLDDLNLPRSESIYLYNLAYIKLASGN